MPRPRFLRLPPDKREHILRSAGQAFAEHGYDGATISHLLEHARISTGAAYYYFDDKADLFTAALTFHIDLLLAAAPEEPATANPEAFWTDFAVGIAETAARVQTVHRTVAALRRAWKTSPELRDIPAIAEQFQRNEALLRRFFRQGRECGAIRTDLPDTLLLRCALAIDEAFDGWLEERASSPQRAPRPAEAKQLIRTLVHLLRDMLAPPDAGGRARTGAPSRARRRSAGGKHGKDRSDPL